MRTNPHYIKRTNRGPWRPIEEYKVLIRIDVDWSSTGIWAITEPRARYSGKNLSYEGLPISEELRKRFEAWTEWHDLSIPEDEEKHADWDLHELYAWSLAIDLNRELGDDYYVEVGGREMHDDIKFLKQITRCA
jgi:hypothetical protein